MGKCRSTKEETSHENIVVMIDCTKEKIMIRGISNYISMTNETNKHRAMQQQVLPPIYTVHFRTLTFIPTPLALAHTLSLTLTGSFLPFSL